MYVCVYIYIYITCLTQTTRCFTSDIDIGSVLCSVIASSQLLFFQARLINGICRYTDREANFGRSAIALCFLCGGVSTVLIGTIQHYTRASPETKGALFTRFSQVQHRYILGKPSRMEEHAAPRPPPAPLLKSKCPCSHRRRNRDSGILKYTNAK